MTGRPATPGPEILDDAGQPAASGGRRRGEPSYRDRLAARVGDKVVDQVLQSEIDGLVDELRGYRARPAEWAPRADRIAAVEEQIKLRGGTVPKD